MKPTSELTLRLEWCCYSLDKLPLQVKFSEVIHPTKSVANSSTGYMKVVHETLTLTGTVLKMRKYNQRSTPLGFSVYIEVAKHEIIRTAP